MYVVLHIGRQQLQVIGQRRSTAAVSGIIQYYFLNHTFVRRTTSHEYIGC